VFIGGVGLGKTHLALAHSTCLNNVPTLFASAVEIVNRRRSALPSHQRPLRAKCQHHHRHTTYKHWVPIFNNDATLTSAILDRILHHCETVTIEGNSYRTQKDP